MNVSELIEKLQRQMQQSGLDWREARGDIHIAHGNATTEAQRVLCLSLHKAVFDAVERDNSAIIPGGMSDFRRTREQDYNLLLIKEAMIGRTDGQIDPNVMKKITDREVTAGRMAADDELHKLSVAGAEILGAHPDRKQSGGILSVIRSWFR